MDYIVKCSNAVEFITFLFQHGFNYVGDYVLMLVNLNKNSIVVANIQDKEFNFANSEEAAKKLVDREFKTIDENQFKLNLSMAKLTTSKFHTKFSEDSCKSTDELFSNESQKNACVQDKSNDWKKYAKPGYFITLKGKLNSVYQEGIICNHNMIFFTPINNKNKSILYTFDEIDDSYYVINILDHTIESDNKMIWQSKTTFLTKKEIEEKLGLKLGSLEII